MIYQYSFVTEHKCEMKYIKLVHPISENMFKFIKKDTSSNVYTIDCYWIDLTVWMTYIVTWKVLLWILLNLCTNFDTMNRFIIWLNDRVWHYFDAKFQWSFLYIYTQKYLHKMRWCYHFNQHLYHMIDTSM